jgi:hypothetical protein
MAQLRVRAHEMACDVSISDDLKKGKERHALPKDYDKRLATALKNLDPQFKKLERRLKKCPKPKAAVVVKKAKKAKRAAPVAPVPTTKPISGPKRKKGLATTILDGDDSTGPMSREGALTEGVAKEAKTTSLLDFLQGSLD